MCSGGTRFLNNAAKYKTFLPLLPLSWIVFIRLLLAAGLSLKIDYLDFLWLTLSTKKKSKKIKWEKFIPKMAYQI
jgi:hypothetical protein